MATKKDYSVLVIGAGSGGLVVAIGAAKAGKKVLLVERGSYGGDCTNFGCIPSKSLLASAQTAETIRTAGKMGIFLPTSKIDCNEALTRVRRIVKEVRTHEEPKALQALGVDAITGAASFIDPYTLSIQDAENKNFKFTAENIVIATGSYPYIPPIIGIKEIPFLTNETIFDLKEIPERLVVIGGGPIGAELGQAFQRLGSKVAIIQAHHHLLMREEPEAQEVIENALKREGVELFLGYDTRAISRNGGIYTLYLESKNSRSAKELSASHILVATGRRPSIESLNLPQAEIAFNSKGIEVDAYGRTSQKHIFAVGDVTGRALFTHAAENEARTVLRNLILPWPFKSKEDLAQPIPRVTYTDPEIASLGMTEELALNNYGRAKISIYQVPFTEVDRAICTGRTEGFVKIITKKWSSRILGAAIVGPRAGEMLPEIGLAMRHNIPLRSLATLIHPYPTYSLSLRKAADAWLTKTILPLFKKNEP